MDNIKLLLKKLSKIEKELDRVRGASPISHGWQTQRFAKASRKWDELAKEKMKILSELNEIRLGLNNSGGYIGEALNSN